MGLSRRTRGTIPRYRPATNKRARAARNLIFLTLQAPPVRPMVNCSQAGVPIVAMVPLPLEVPQRVQLAVHLGSQPGLAFGNGGVGWVELRGLVEEDTRLFESRGSSGLAHGLQRSAVVTVHVGQVDLGLALLGVGGFESLADGRSEEHTS